MNLKTFFVSCLYLVIINLNSYSRAQNSLQSLQIQNPNQGQGCGSVLQSDILKQLYVGYDREVRPPPGDSPTLVSSTANVLNIPSVDEEKRQWTMNLYFRQEWNDPRLQYQKMVQGCSNFKFIQLTTEEGVASVWKPNLFFPDQVDGEIVDLLQTNRVIRIFPNGNVFYSVHMSVTLFCSGKGSRPGEFLCPFQLYPYGPEVFEIQLSWKQPNPIQLDNSNTDMANHVLGPIDTSVIETKSGTGRYSTLLANFHFLRKACLA